METGPPTSEKFVETSAKGGAYQPDSFNQDIALGRYARVGSSRIGNRPTRVGPKIISCIAGYAEAKAPRVHRARATAWAD